MLHFTGYTFILSPNRTVHYRKINASLHAQHGYSFQPQTVTLWGAEPQTSKLWPPVIKELCGDHLQVGACYCFSGPGLHRVLPTAVESCRAVSSVLLLLLLHSRFHPDNRALSALGGLL